MSFTKTQNKFSRGIDDKADGTAVTIDETGKVGVGTSDPSQKLTISDVSAPVYISQNRGNVSSLVGPDGADGGLYIGTTSDHEVRMHTSGERRLTIDTAGNVGIGTNDPSLLEVRGSNEAATFRGEDSQLIKVNFSQSPNTAELDVRNAGNFYISKQGTPAITIDNSGNSNFSGTVTAGSVETPEVSGNHFSLSSATFVEADTGEDIAYYGLTLDTSTNYWTRFSGFTGCAFYTNGQKRLAIDADGDAQFSGSVTADDGTFSDTFVAGKNAGTTTIDNRSIYSPYVGIRLGGGQFPDNILPCDDGGSSTGGKCKPRPSKL